MSCFVPFVLIFRVWRPLFIFLHLYFGPYSRNIGIYFPTLCASIVHHACIYIYIYMLALFQCDYCNPCHLRLAMPNFHREVRRLLVGFRDGNLALCSNALRKRRLGPHPFKSQNLKAPMLAKPRKPMPKSCFYCQSPKIKILSKQRTIFRTAVMGCLTPSPHISKLPNLRIKIFCHPH